MFKIGTCVGTAALIENIKEVASGSGWQIVGEKTETMNKIPADLEGFLFDDIKDGRALFDQKAGTSGGEAYISLPRIAGIKSATLTNPSKISIWGVDDENRAHPIKTDFSGGEVNSAPFLRYKIKGVNTHGVDLELASELVRAREINLFSPGSSEKASIWVNFRSFLGPSSRNNLVFSAAGGFSELANFNSQFQSLGQNSGVLGSWDGEIKYFISASKNRIILGTKIHDINDAQEKNPVFELGYVGFLRLWGGAWKSGDLMAVCAPSYERDYRWQNANSSDFERPKLFLQGAWRDFDEDLVRKKIEWNDENMNITPYPSGEAFCAPCLIYHTENRNNIAKSIFGELDGISRVVASPAMSSFDEALIENEECILFANGKNQKEFYAINKL